MVKVFLEELKGLGPFPDSKFLLPPDGKYPTWCKHGVGIVLKDGMNCTICGFFVPKDYIKP
jgi:hypothetical protein